MQYACILAEFFGESMLPVIQIGSLSFYTFGLLFGVALCVGTYTFLRYFREHGLVVDAPILTVMLIGCGFAGAKLDNAWVIGMHVLHGHPFSGSMAGFFAGGYTYLGCLLGGSMGAALYVAWARLPWLRTFDAMFCIAPAYALGRVGCFLAGDGDYGTPSTLPWAVAFPHGLVPTAVRVHPTMLYSSVWELTVFLVLWRLSQRQWQPAGRLLALYLIATGTGRFLVEGLSRNPVLALHGTEAQWVSLGCIGAGTGLLVCRRGLLAGRPAALAIVSRSKLADPVSRARAV